MSIILALATLKEWYAERSVQSCEVWLDSYDGLFVAGNLATAKYIVYGEPTGGQQVFDLSKVNTEDKESLKALFIEAGIPFKE